MKQKFNTQACCPKCGCNRWKTKMKGKIYQCRDCGWKKEIK